MWVPLVARRYNTIKGIYPWDPHFLTFLFVKDSEVEAKAWVHPSLPTVPAPLQCSVNVPWINKWANCKSPHVLSCLALLGHCNHRQFKQTNNELTLTAKRLSVHAPSDTVNPDASDPSCIFRQALSPSKMLKSRHNETAIHVFGMSKGWFDHIQERLACHQKEFRQCYKSPYCLTGDHCKGFELGIISQQGCSISHLFSNSCPRNENNGKQLERVLGTGNLNTSLTDLGDTDLALCKTASTEWGIVEESVYCSENSLQKPTRGNTSLRPQCQQKLSLYLINVFL